MYTHVHTGKDFGEPISRGEMHKNWWSKLSNWATYERAVKKIKVTNYSKKKKKHIVKTPFFFSRTFNFLCF